jgi:uncharacterized circularly permuted ATP-grasp superfamily protein
MSTTPAQALHQRHHDSLADPSVDVASLARRARDWMTEHDVVFAGQPIPFVLSPHWLDADVSNRIRHAVEVLARVLDRFCSAYRTDDVLRRALNLPPAESELLRIVPTLDDPLQLARLDAFLLDDGNIQFLEFNAESPAGIGYTDVMFDGLSELLPALAAEGSNAPGTYERIIPHLVRTVRDVEARWRTWAHDHASASIPPRCERPNVVLIDTADSPSVPEFRIICRALEAAGYHASHATLDELRRHDGRLFVGDTPIDVVYRRALVEDILDPHASSGAAALIASVRDGAVAMLNPFPARVANNKKLLALLGAPEFAHLLHDDEEREIVASCIPWTRIVAPGGSSLPGGDAGDLPHFIRSHRTQLVLKPASDYGGHNVHLGVNTDQDLWDSLVDAHAGTGEWIVQQYLAVPRGEFTTIENGELVTQLRFFNINPFAIGGRYAGMITRISTEPVINVSAGGGLLPCVAVGRI